MIFPSVEFAALFVVVLPLSWLLMPYRSAWKLLLIGTSYIFYGYANPRFVLLLVICTIWNAGLAELIARTRKGPLGPWFLGAAVAGDLTLLGWFKYYGFFAGSVADLTARLGLPMPLPLLQVGLPVAISFYTFMAISYVIDVKRGSAEPVSFLDFAVYLAFFPHLVAGPIVRVGELVPQFATPRDPSRIEATRAFGLIASGLVKKILFADVLAQQLVDPVFDVPGMHSRIDVIAAIYGYAIQIYCDFSAYSDMAIGVALLLGFQFPQNFNRPYAAVTLQEFWHRWHMSLSRWLRDYLYISLGGNRKGRLKTYRNLLLTMVLGGLWHGAAWKFILWGGMHGGGLAAERWWNDLRPGSAVRWPLLRWLITFHLVCVAWVFFRADDLAAVGSMASRLGATGGATVLSPLLVLTILGGLGMHFVPRTHVSQAQAAFGRLALPVQAAALAVILALTGLMISGQGVAPFIYYRF